MNVIRLRLILFLAFVAFADAAFAQGQFIWDKMTSDEKPPAVCPGRQTVVGLVCQGRFCNNVGIRCVDVGASSGEGGSYTQFFSEERKDFVLCPARHVIAGIACNGDFCDNIALYCVPSPHSRFDRCIDSLAISEEEPGFIAWASDVVPVGIRCFGSNCDNKSIRLCRPGS